MARAESLQATEGRTPMRTRLEHANVIRLLAGELYDPFELLGRHGLACGEVIVRIHQPGAGEVRLVEADAACQRIDDSDLFEWTGPAAALPARYRVRWRALDGIWHEHWDPYCFAPMLQETELARFNAGEHVRVHRMLGAHEASSEGIAGLRFALWAPAAMRISVVGDFNGWDGRRHPMRVRGSSGVWELFIPGLIAGVLYKFEIRSRHDGVLPLKADPYARASELRPQTASIAAPASAYEWQDAWWLAQRARSDWTQAPMSVYELHAGSWRHDDYGRPLGYRALADSLVPYLQKLGFTHVELLPLTEYPLDESWGYQPTGMFAATCRYGEADDLKYFIDHCHRHGIGVLLDWVAGHFPGDAHGLARFDGSALYECADPRRANHPDWGTLEFNYARHEVASFLLSSALYWLEEFHFDGLRVDAVASMLYLDYSRQPGEWTPNAQGGNENLEAVAFLRRLNALTHHEVPGSLTIAEESTAWPGVSRPVWENGLGFSMKWNMGWMHDTLQYFAHDPVHRRHYHQQLTFAAMYASTENFVLPLSHDEVVHGKGSLLRKMPGDSWQRFANLRLLYTLQWCFPGKKLIFMGAELAVPQEWNERLPLPWALLEQPAHAGVSLLIRDLNRLYRELPALHRHDFDTRGFAWLNADDEACSTLAFQRCCDEQRVVVVLNATPVPRHGYRVGVPMAGCWQECFNSDSRHYGGSDLGNPLPLQAEPVPLQGCDHSLVLTLPPLGGVVLQHSSTTTL